MNSSPKNIQLKSVLSIFAFCSLFVVSCNTDSFNSNLKWTYTSPREVAWSGYGSASTPVEAGDYIVYSGGYFWQNQVFLYVVDKKTGRLVWKNDKSTYQYVCSKDYVVISTREAIHKKSPGQSRKSKIICYRLKTGEELWSREVSIRNVEPQIFPINKSIKNLYIWLPGNELSCLDLKSGSLIWRKGNSKKSRLFTVSMITTHGDTIYLVEPNGGLLIIDGLNGKLENFFKLDKLPKAYITKIQFVDDKLLIYGSTGFLTICDIKKTKILLNHQFGNITETTTIENGILYFGRLQKLKGLPEEGKFSLACIDFNSKKDLWLKEFQHLKFSQPVSGKKNVFIGALEKSEIFYALDKKSGKISWQKDIGPIKGVPVYDSGTVYLCGKEYFYALSAKDGSLIWKIKPKQFEPTASPLVSKDSVYFVGQDAGLYCVKSSPTELKSEQNPKEESNQSKKTELLEQTNPGDSKPDQATNNEVNSVLDSDKVKESKSESSSKNSMSPKSGKIRVESNNVENNTPSTGKD